MHFSWGRNACVVTTETGALCRYTRLKTSKLLKFDPNTLNLFPK